MRRVLWAAETRTADWIPFNNLANCLIVTGKYDEALEYAQQAKEIAPTSPFVTGTIGWAFHNKGMYEAAVKQLEAFKNDQMALRRYHLAMAYFKNGETAQGVLTPRCSRWILLIRKQCWHNKSQHEPRCKTAESAP